ncbi:uncharacterized protein BJ212DRAFT_1491107 [Suillus subaureus]|uniref:Uncharacterized protein n=1 Tax=Suillus subaureus TaxID=48587 RepID=A0A9P7DEJ4_9AGAM|nr:uncharacterized protein BJ212DRAFT_1491107 [Suillus subaureus]KAG1791000.1 hypothetical protein BJ212DRAFT_1491107 [Suillus subaureus]
MHYIMNDWSLAHNDGKSWLAAVTISLKKAENAMSQVTFMLILDVKTCWSSTHQMLWQALDFHQAIDDFIAKT